MAKLGEFWLLGFPINPANPVFSESPTLPIYIERVRTNTTEAETLRFRRDYGLAIQLFKEAKQLDSRDAPFWIAFLVQ
jgi:hypothetical protein